MSRTSSIKLKAIFLLMIFSLNIVVGFACAVGLDMGFNNTHHHNEEETETHIHGDGHSHIHEKGAHKHSDKTSKNDCCNDKVIKLSNVDKAIPQLAKLLSPVFVTAFLATYYNSNINYTSQVNSTNKDFERGYYPPISDIRIAIQSFQI